MTHEAQGKTPEERAEEIMQWLADRWLFVPVYGNSIGTLQRAIAEAIQAAIDLDRAMTFKREDDLLLIIDYLADAGRAPITHIIHDLATDYALATSPATRRELLRRMSRCRDAISEINAIEASVEE